jgi:hypothetical protein
MQPGWAGISLDPSAARGLTAYDVAIFGDVLEHPSIYATLSLRWQASPATSTRARRSDDRRALNVRSRQERKQLAK